MPRLTWLTRSPAAAAFMTFTAFLGTLASGPAAVAADPAADYPMIRQQAEALYAEGSYARANSLYLQASDIAAGLPKADQRWIAFRVADTMWRAQAGTQTHDDTIFEKARAGLAQVIAAITRPEDRDLAWAEANESLGDFWWVRRQSQNWGAGWQHYQQALDWWSGHRDLETARRRYLDMVWRIAEPPWRMDQGWYGYYNVPLDILENARTIARTDLDRARAHYLLAMGLRQYGGYGPQQQRTQREFEAALAFGAESPWYDDALFQYAQWLGSNGPILLTPDGQWRQEPDFVKAVEMYRRLMREFRKGQTRYYDEAKSQIEQITAPQLAVTVSNVFLPSSEIRFDMSWRNLKAIELALYRVDLTRQLAPAASERSIGDWIWHLDVGTAEKVRSWTHDTKDSGSHKWGSATQSPEGALPVGAYVLVATGGGKTARELVLVTDVSVVLKSWRGKVLAFVCSAMDGSPVPKARVRLWDYRYTQGRWSGADTAATTGDDGLCRFDVGTVSRNNENRYGYLVTASIDGRQAFAAGAGFNAPSPPSAWKVYAVTDRPAYRPLETVQWKMTARTNDGSGYATPSQQKVRYEITGPRGKVGEGDLVLNAFGSAWGELALDESMALGEYAISFRTGSTWIGQAQLFRLEEYKLPEFEVSVQSARDDQGRKKSFRLGDTVEVAVEAGYYFGGPVANANVEVIVHQNPFYHWWAPPHEYPWCYTSGPQNNYWGGYGQVIKRQTIRTDQAGRATLAFETPAGGGQDFEYRIEARVTDSSRREVVGADSVRVTRQRYYVYPTAAHNIIRPGDAVEIDFKALDANNEPVSVAGTVVVTRDRWVEIWLDPSGKEVTGRALQEARLRHKAFPPRPDDGAAPWRMKFQGYESQEILKRTVKTDEAGAATLSFTAEREGYYRIAWTSEDPGSTPVTAATTVWVADDATTDLGYRAGGVQIIVDADTFRAGRTAPVMLTVPTNDRYVLFSVEGNDLHDYKLVHVTGTVKLIELPIGEKHVPNVYLNALMVTDGQIFAAQAEVVVPPVDHYLDVEVRADRDAYKPREDGTLTVVTRDMDGKPVPAEVALSMVDESVYYIQQAYAGDPRPFFFNDRQATHIVQTSSTFNHRGYVKLVKSDGNQVIDSRLLGQLNEEGQGRHKEYRELDRMERGAYKLRRDTGLAGPADEMSDMAASFESSGMVSKSMAVPGTPAAAPEQKAQAAPGGEPAVVVRSDFRSTILWKPDVVTGKDGTATVTLTYPDNVTRWKAVARAATTGNQVGMGESSTRTRQPLIARLQAPRFFVVGDTVTLSGVFNNNTDEPMKVRPTLEVKGLSITGVMQGGRAAGSKPEPVTIPANSEARVDWIAAVEEPGEARIWLTARSDTYADAMEKSYPVHEHGVEKFIAKSGKVRGEAVTVTLDIPGQRKTDSTVLAVSVTSSMAVTMLDALPYLVQYPYGCTEQTMSRFMPAVVTAATLRDLGLSPEDALGRVFGGIEQQFVEKTQHKGAERRQNLVKLNEITNQGLERLYGFQHGDGGWGWWKDGDSDHFMTSYVLWGLSLGRRAYLDVRGDVMDRAARFLDLELVEQETNPDMQAWMLHALAAYHSATKQKAMSEHSGAAVANLWKRRDGLNAYTRALFALAMHDYGQTEKAQVLVTNLENGVKRDEAPDTSVLLGTGRKRSPAVIGTAHWGDDGVSWRWSDGGVEATAFALRALLAIDPGNELIEPVTNWLVKNRRGAQWSNTRDTAITVLALNDYLRASGELEPQFEYELLVNGKSIAKKKVTAAEALTAPSRYTIDPGQVKNGANEITIVRRNGQGSIYFAAEATYFSLEEPVPPAGNEIFVRRDYYKLVPRETLLKGYVYVRTPLADGDYVNSVERVEVLVTVEAKNNYEYLVFEDLKPAGLEAVQLRSGELMYARELKSGAVERKFGGLPAGEPQEGGVRQPGWQPGWPEMDLTGRQRWIYQELRDRNVALFIDKLPVGVWQMTYDLRAEIPGQFHALPLLGHAMYVPEIRCNSAEIRITVNDRPEPGMAAAGD